jgi:hypothetical protein
MADSSSYYSILFTDGRFSKQVFFQKRLFVKALLKAVLRAAGCKASVSNV